MCFNIGRIEGPLAPLYTIMPAIDLTRPARDLSDFRLLTLNCECRFENAYLLWDRAGAVWSQFLSANPKARSIRAEPNQTVFRLEEDFEFTLKLDRINVSALGSCSPELFGKAVGDFADIVIPQLQVGNFLRIGFRPIFVRDHTDMAAATAEFTGLDLVHILPTPTFGVTGKTIEARYFLRIEDESKGCLVQIVVAKRSYEPELPFGWEGSDLTKIEKIGLIFDVDYYTTRAATVGQVSLPEWIRQAMHVIYRDSKALLGAKPWRQGIID